MPMRIVPLAFNEHGHRFPVAAEASFWLVKAMKKGPGAPRQLWVEDTAMTLPIEDGLGDLRELAGVGRFRLDAIDQLGMPVPGMPPAYVEVIEVAPPPAPVDAPALRNAGPVAEPSSMVSTSECLRLIEALALSHAQTAREATANSRAIMEAAAALVRAADGAGIASRPWMADEYRNAAPEGTDGADVDDEVEATPPAPTTEPRSLRDMFMEKFMDTAFRGIDAFVTTKLAPSLPGLPLVPATLPAATAGRAAGPTAAPVARQAPPSAPPAAAPSATASTPEPRPAPAAPVAVTAAATPAAASPAATPQNADAGAPAVNTDSATSDGQKLAEEADAAEKHLEAIMAALTPEEQAKATRLIQLAPAAQANQFLAYLAGLPVDQALAVIREQLAKLPI